MVPMRPLRERLPLDGHTNGSRLLAAMASALLVTSAAAGCSDDEEPTGPGGGTPTGIGGMGGEGAAAGTGGTGGSAGSDGGGGGGATVDPLPGEKWIPTFVVKYCGTSNLLSAEETAKFDLLITGPGLSQAWTDSGNSWQTLKSYNPDMKIALYVLGPSEFNTSSWGVLGADQWSWVTTEHGIGTADPWTGHGYANPDRYLYNQAYSNERIMDLGNASWRQFFYTEVYEALWGGADPHVGADGIFSDVTGYDVPYTGQWRVDGGPNADAVDHPAQYYDGSSYDHAKHRTEMNAFFDEALPWLAAQSTPVAFMPNFTSLENDDQWAELDQRANHPYAAMHEAGLVQPYGAYTFGVFHFQSRLQTINALANVKSIDMCQGKSDDLSGEGLARMDSSGSTGPGDGATTMTGWEALWLSMCSHMAAINAERNNAYLGFTVWGYCEYHWLDEFDPTYIHLGDAVGDAFTSDEATYREFEDGWVACNGTTGDLTGLSVPAGQARVIDHDNFKDPDSASLVSSFDLPLHRGVILLKDGHTLGNGT